MWKAKRWREVRGGNKYKKKINEKKDIDIDKVRRA
jgi:hypothetical protein